MREHPIPQDIVGYKFHIIGNMTLKQFAELAAGALGGVIIYSTNLPAPLKWPLIFISISIGGAAAFLPIEERPLDHWIMTFIKTMYKPTKFYWQRSKKIPEVFTYTPNDNQAQYEPEVDLSPARRQRIKDYLASVQPNDGEVDPLSQQEQLWMQEIMNNFKTVKPKQVEVVAQASKPELTVKMRGLSQNATDAIYGLGSAVTVFDQKQQPVVEKAQKAIHEVAPELEIPVTPAIEVEQPPVPVAAEETSAQEGAYIAPEDTTVEQNLAEGVGVTFNSALPFPSKPTVSNKLVGMILTPNNELIPEAIVEVRDANNHVVRAVKSNALGQFFITTPLKKGDYTIGVEHDNYQFSPLEISLKNEAVDPIEVRSLG